MAELRFSGEAVLDLVDISNFSAERWDEDQSEQYMRALNECFQQVSEFPFAGRLRAELVPGLRSIVCREHTVFYIIGEDAVLIARVLSTRQDPHGAFDGPGKD